MIQQFFRQATTLTERISVFDNYKILHGIALFHGCIDDKFHKTVIAGKVWKKFSKSLGNKFFIILFKCPVS